MRNINALTKCTQFRFKYGFGYKHSQAFPCFDKERLRMNLCEVLSTVMIFFD